jgi:hemerythrin superfamily protein
MDAIVLLKDDHKTVEKLFKDYEKLQKSEGTPAAKKRVVDQIVKELTTHAYIEETIFYPTAREAVPETAEHVLESVEEHHVVVWVLSELMHLDPSDERYDAKVTVLMENVRHHVEEEEQDWFPDVRKGLGRKRLQELGEQMQAAKAQAPSDPLALISASA